VRARVHSAMFLACVLAGIGLAQAIQQPGNPPAPPATQQPVVVRAEPETSQLGGEITLTVQNLDSWIGNSAQTLPQLIPFLDGHPLTGSKLLWVKWDTGQMRFVLLRDSTSKESRDAWARVLGGFGNGVLNGPRVLNVSAGKVNEAPLPTQAKLMLHVFPKPWGMISLVALLGLAAGFGVLVVRSWILRASGPAAGQPGPYSLSVCQMVWWFFVVLSSFVVVWLMTGDLGLPASTLVLIGISSATGLGAKVIGMSQEAPRTKDFFTDILSDNSGVSFHRFQIFAWTIILSIVFISHVVSYVALPDFAATLLTLMGISSGTYLGFKIPEKR
jgi:hypothetical protein